MNPSTHSASLKKIHLYLQSIVEGHFYFIYFSVFVSFWDLFFSNSFCFEWRPCAIKCDASYTCHFSSSDCLGFALIMCLCVVVELAYLGVVTNEFICDQWDRKECILAFISLHGVIWDQRQMPFILLWRFLCDFLNCTFILTSICNLTLQSIPFGAITWNRALLILESLRQQVLG
jgi:hypothetical protein